MFLPKNQVNFSDPIILLSAFYFFLGYADDITFTIELKLGVQSQQKDKFSQFVLALAFYEGIFQVVNSTELCDVK